MAQDVTEIGSSKRIALTGRDCVSRVARFTRERSLVRNQPRPSAPEAGLPGFKR